MLGHVALLGLLAGAAPAPATALRDHEVYRLDNGLTVILHPVRDVPLVRVHVRYHVGGADDPRHRRGLAHVVEHLTFEGTAHIEAGKRMQALYEVGAIDENADTSLVDTDYYLTVPADYTATALWIESDRLGYSAVAATRRDLRAVQRVVANERRQRIDTQPYAGLQVQVAEALYPPAHPYHGRQIGSLLEIAAATPDEAREFLERWYVPANATLVLVGDLPPDTRRLVDRYFGSLPGRDPPTRGAPTPVAPTRETILRTVEPLGRSAVAYVAWPTAALFTADDAVADVLVTALNEGAFERLSRAGDTREVGFGQHSLPVQSRTYVILSGDAAVGPDALLAALDRVLDRVVAGELTAAEVRRARSRMVARTIAGLQSLAGRAERLLDYHDHRGTPDWLAEDLRRYLAVTPEAVARFARDSLARSRRVVLLAAPAAASAAVEEAPP